MNYEIFYDLDQLEQAAKYVASCNNSSCRSAEEVRTMILEDIRRIADENFRRGEENWISWIGTGGYYLLFTLDDSDSIIPRVEAQILIDPRIGMNSYRYVTEVIDTQD